MYAFPPFSQGQPSQLQHLLPSSHVGAIMQDLPEILTDCLQRQYCPVGGLINLVNLWHSAYQQLSTASGTGVVIVSSSSCVLFSAACWEQSALCRSLLQRREPSKKLAMFRALLECFGEGLKTPRRLLLSNIFSITQVGAWK